jgi:hypothetical protein
MAVAIGEGTREHPWQLKTPPGTSEYQMWRDDAADPPALVCQMGSTQLRCYLRCIEDLHAMLEVAPLLEALGLAELEHNARNNRMRAS